MRVYLEKPLGDFFMLDLAYLRFLTTKRIFTCNQ